MDSPCRFVHYNTYLYLNTSRDINISRMFIFHRNNYLGVITFGSRNHLTRRFPAHRFADRTRQLCTDRAREPCP